MSEVACLAYYRAARVFREQETEMDRQIQDAMRESLSIKGMAVKLAPLRRVSSYDFLPSDSEPPEAA